MQTLCKCHGVSASCTVKICWRSLADFSRVGDALKQSYEGAVQVTYNEQRGKLKPLRKHVVKPKKKDLVYVDYSPNFCLPDASKGSLGTVGRECNRTSHALDSCELMCCGRGFFTELREVVEDCNCRFVWCCNVECESCTREQEFNYCK